MILVERGKVDLRAAASRYVPELAKLPPFTIEQLLTHTSGLPAETPISDYASTTPTDHSAVMRTIGDRLAGKLKALPGERFLYSDVGFVILEEVVRRRGGKDVATFHARRDLDAARHGRDGLPARSDASRASRTHRAA